MYILGPHPLGGTVVHVRVRENTSLFEYQHMFKDTQITKLPLQYIYFSQVKIAQSPDLHSVLEWTYKQRVIKHCIKHV